MKEIRRIKINGTPNRKGLILEVLSAMVDYGINIITMESDPYICCKIDWEEGMEETEFLGFMQARVPEISSISYIDLMEYERIETELGMLLDNINDAILKLDPQGMIISCNDKCQIFMETGKTDKRSIQEIIPKSVVNFDQAVESGSVEFIQMIGKKEKAFLANINAIQNEQGIITGYFVIINEMANIRNLINTIMRPSMVTFDDIFGESQAMKNTIAMARSIAPTPASVLLRGESGTGKELFARAIHMGSARADAPFVAVNCASIPEALLESEFFGYEKGSFTGASASGKQGFFELASGGTLFLDEIGELAVHLQAKILRALQEQKIRRIGGRHEIDIDVRIISATNRDLEKMVEEKSFREDLYYRLNIIPIHIPPLREREGDVERFIHYFIADIAHKQGRAEMDIAPEAVALLLDYHWPGNVRELNNVIERAVCIAGSRQIQANDLLLDRGAVRPEPQSPEPGEAIQFPVDLPKQLARMEKEYIEAAMERFGSYRKVAANLNISHTTAMNRLHQYAERCK